MAEQYNRDDRRRGNRQSFMSLYNYVMGAIWLAMGLLFLLNKPLNIDWIKSDPLIDTIFGVVGIVYGLFRLYRAYKQKEFNR